VRDDRARHRLALAALGALGPGRGGLAGLGGRELAGDEQRLQALGFGALAEEVGEVGDDVGGHPLPEAWLEGRRSPSPQNLARIEDAYRTVRRHNVARGLLARLNRQGRGTRVEFHPLNHSQVPRPRQRELGYRTLNVRHWDRIVAAWAAGDDAALDDAWVSDAVVDLGSEWGQYEYVTNIGFAA
jgi:hypothetical protein